MMSLQRDKLNNDTDKNDYFIQRIVSSLLHQHVLTFPKANSIIVMTGSISQK